MAKRLRAQRKLHKKLLNERAKNSGWTVYRYNPDITVRWTDMSEDMHYRGFTTTTDSAVTTTTTNTNYIMDWTPPAYRFNG